MLKRRFLSLFIISAALVSFSGCEVINPDEDAPSYLRINPIQFDPGTHIGRSHKIEDTWVYVNDGKENRLIGTFELPATIPVLVKGRRPVTIYAGTYADGIRGARFIYPFYTFRQDTLSFEEGNIIEITPQVTYKNNLEFKIEEDFSDVQRELKIGDANTLYTLENSSDPALQFEHSDGQVGVVYTKQDTTSTIIIESVYNGPLPQNGSLVYLEMDYKSTIEFRVGVEVLKNGALSYNEPLRMKPSNEWNKLYVNLVEEISYVNDRTATFKVRITGFPTGRARDYIALDNVKLIHYKQ